MRLGISSYAYTWAVGVPGSIPSHPMSVFDLLDRARTLGVSLVQIADNLPLDQVSDFEAFKAQARGFNITVEVGTRGIQRDHLLRYLDLAAQLQSPILRVVIDTADHHPTPDEVVHLLRPVLPEFEIRGVTLAVENHDRFAASTLRGIIEQLNSPAIGICLDTINSFGALEGPPVVVETLAPYVVNLHIKDFTIFRSPHMMGFSIEGRPAGQGRLNIPWLLEQLRQSRFSFNAILELWTPPESTIDQTITKESAWAVESIAYLRQLISER